MINYNCLSVCVCMSLFTKQKKNKEIKMYLSMECFDGISKVFVPRWMDGWKKKTANCVHT